MLKFYSFPDSLCSLSLSLSLCYLPFSAVSSNIPPGSFPAPTSVAHSLSGTAPPQPLLSSSAQLAQYLTDFESDFICDSLRPSGQQRTVPAVPPPVVDAELEQELAELEELEGLIAAGQSTTTASAEGQQQQQQQQQHRWIANECQLSAPSVSSASSTASSLETEHGKRRTPNPNARPNPSGAVRDTAATTAASPTTTSKMAPPPSSTGQQQQPRSVSFASPPTTSQIEPDGSRSQTLASKKSPLATVSSSLGHNVYPSTKDPTLTGPTFTSSQTPKASLLEGGKDSPERPGSLELFYPEEEEGEEFDEEMAAALAPGLVGYKALDADTLAGMEYIPTLKVSLNFTGFL